MRDRLIQKIELFLNGNISKDQHEIWKTFLFYFDHYSLVEIHDQLFYWFLRFEKSWTENWVTIQFGPLDLMIQTSDYRMQQITSKQLKLSIICKCNLYSQMPSKQPCFVCLKWNQNYQYYLAVWSKALVTEFPYSLFELLIVFSLKKFKFYNHFNSSIFVCKKKTARKFYVGTAES